ncbi:MAG: hypothetical protein ACKPCI_03225, partial [Dolichospermum sp.]
VITGNIRDFYLPCHDPDHGEAISIKFYPSKLFKHPLKEQERFLKEQEQIKYQTLLSQLKAKGIDITALE